MTINDTKPVALTTEWLRWGVSAPAALFSILYLAAILVYIAIAGVPFTYPLDDTYIHMALARTIVDSHVWGLSPTEPGAASSSPLWTLILAGSYAVLGARNFLYVPIALNAALTVLLIVVLSRIFRGKAYSLWLVGSILYAGSILSLSALGMEHVLHALLAIVFCAFASQTLAGPRELETPQRLVGLGVLTALCVTARYESLVSCLFRRRGRGCAPAFCGVAAFGFQRGGALDLVRPDLGSKRGMVFAKLADFEAKARRA